ncbi:PP2C family protein-serine/threonine phosphatase [Paenibacillus hexagrammi]|uniref:SpoIIE family protein phosphatase n=1 Tax=Paenibacillus hexagrammi TaxID=2908839 RepID=A0ABY3SMC3_9BACL|nr:GAF domain-containing SpoIIE family protein phosphatase [Paenibacillus sp. YPD9-1]UJF34107.1 SpoIIE family protein phosphatase [Paenibacillus sp. YPD9-1]
MDWLPVALLLIAACVSGLWLRSERLRRSADKELNRTLQLFEVSLEMNSTLRKQDLLGKIMETTSRLMEAEASSVILVDRERGELYFDLALGEKGEEVREIRLKIGEGIAGWVAQTGQSVKIDDAASDERWSSKVAKRVDYPTRNMLCVPLVSKGDIIGVLQVLNKRSGLHFTDRDLLLLESIAAPIAISLENAMLYDALEKSMIALKTTTAAKEKMESELRIARDIQMSFLPRGSLVVSAAAAAGDSLGIASVEVPGSEFEEAFGEGTKEASKEASNEASRGASGSAAHLGSSVEIGAVIRPAKEVGGDFFDYFELGQDRLFFALGDVSDKGIPAALFMSVIMTLIKGKMTLSMTPAQLLTEVNRELYKDDSSMFATICCGVLHTGTGKFVYSDGGHCTPYMVRGSGEVESLRGKKGLPLAVLEEMIYSDNEAWLEPGDRLVLYTDGISEAEDPDQHQYGMERLRNVLVDTVRSVDSETPTEPDLLKRILDDVDLFTSGAQQSDDIAVLHVHRKLPI